MTHLRSYYGHDIAQRRACKCARVIDFARAAIIAAHRLRSGLGSQLTLASASAEEREARKATMRAELFFWSAPKSHARTHARTCCTHLCVAEAKEQQVLRNGALACAPFKHIAIVLAAKVVTLA